MTSRDDNGCENQKWRREAADLMNQSVQYKPIYYRSVECGFVGKLVGFQEHNGAILRILAGVKPFDQSIEFDNVRFFDKNDIERCEANAVSSSVL